MKTQISQTIGFQITATPQGRMLFTASLHWKNINMAIPQIHMSLSWKCTAYTVFVRVADTLYIIVSCPKVIHKNSGFWNFLLIVYTVFGLSQTVCRFMEFTYLLNQDKWWPCPYSKWSWCLFLTWNMFSVPIWSSWFTTCTQ